MSSSNEMSSPPPPPPQMPMSAVASVTSSLHSKPVPTVSSSVSVPINGTRETRPKTTPNLFWVFNPDHFKTVSGIVQTIQMVRIMYKLLLLNLQSLLLHLKVLCALCIGLVGWYDYTCFNGAPGIFFILIFTTYLIGTFTLFVSSLISAPTAERLPRTTFVSNLAKIVKFNLIIFSGL